MGQPTSGTIIGIYLYCWIAFYIVIIDYSSSSCNYHRFISFYIFYDYGRIIIDSSLHQLFCNRSFIAASGFHILFS